MIPMIGNFPTAAIPNGILPAPALISVDLTTLVALGGAALVGLLAASAVRLARHSGRRGSHMEPLPSGRARSGEGWTMVRSMATLGVLLLGPAWLGGCATIAHGTRQEIRLLSAPSDATVYVESRRISTPGEWILCAPAPAIALIGPVRTQVTKTPGNLTLSRSRVYTARIEKAGYLPAEVQITRRGSEAAQLDIFTALFGLCIDMATGAAYDLGPETVSVTLQPIPDDAAGQP